MKIYNHHHKNAKPSSYPLIWISKYREESLFVSAKPTHGFKMPANWTWVA